MTRQYIHTIYILMLSWSVVHIGIVTDEMVLQFIAMLVTKDGTEKKSSAISI